MSAIDKPERITQNRIIKLFREELAAVFAEQLDRLVVEGEREVQVNAIPVLNYQDVTA